MWRYEPGTTHVIGAEPFRARGLAYVSALRYVDSRIAGGRDAFKRALGRDRFADYYDQIFVVTGDYDVSPLVRLLQVSASLDEIPIAAFIEDRARWSGGADSKGVWKPSLLGMSGNPRPEQVAERLNFAFNRYFSPCDAKPLETKPGAFRGELYKVPAHIDGFYVSSTVGFYRGALEGVGARDITFEWEKPVSDGAHAGTPVERVRFRVTWS